MSRKFQPGSEMLLDPPDWAVLLWFHAKCLHLWLTCDSHSQCKARVKGPAKGSDFKKLLSEVLPAKREGWSFLFKWVTHGCLGNFSSESPMGQPLQSRWHHGPQAVKQPLLSMSEPWAGSSVLTSVTCSGDVVQISHSTAAHLQHCLAEPVPQRGECLTRQRETEMGHEKVSSSLFRAEWI